MKLYCCYGSVERCHCPVGQDCRGPIVTQLLLSVYRPLIHVFPSNVTTVFYQLPWVIPLYPLAESRLTLRETVATPFIHLTIPVIWSRDFSKGLHSPLIWPQYSDNMASIFNVQIKMSEVGQNKCSYYSSGYCKLSRKPKGCRLFHPETNCLDKNCRNKDCSKRHPHTCRFGQTCRFQSRCLYLHSTENNLKESTEMTEAKQQILALKEEIVKTKSDK